jgi:hypothetical protein
MMPRLRCYLLLLPVSLFAAERISVCDVVANRAEYNGQVVAIRGEVAAGAHGTALIPDGACNYRLITAGVEWPNTIFLTYPSNGARDAAVHAPFPVDWKAMRREEEFLKREGFRAFIDKEFATFEGLFVTYTDLDKRVSPGIPAALRLGFGPTGLEPRLSLLFERSWTPPFRKAKRAAISEEALRRLSRFLQVICGLDFEN